jgi:hypothetical protein
MGILGSINLVRVDRSATAVGRTLAPATELVRGYARNEMSSAISSGCRARRIGVVSPTR